MSSKESQCHMLPEIIYGSPREITMQTQLTLDNEKKRTVLPIESVILKCPLKKKI